MRLLSFLIQNVNVPVVIGYRAWSLVEKYRTYILDGFCRASARDIDIANLSVRPSVRPSVRYVPVPDENGLTYRHSFFTVR